jgi:hypothetical protein
VGTLERKGENVKHMSLKLVLVTALALATSGPLTGADSTATSGTGPTFKHLGTLAFGPDGVLFAADGQDVSITALQLARQMAGGTAGTKDVPAINQKIAALLGIDAKNLLITDMVVNPRTGNTGSWKPSLRCSPSSRRRSTGCRIVASYLCTPLVKFPVSALSPGSKVQGTTIAEFGNRNRPVDMAACVIDSRRRRRQPHRTSVRSRGTRRRPPPFRSAFSGVAVLRAQSERR